MICLDFKSVVLVVFSMGISNIIEFRYIIQTWVESSASLPQKLLDLGYELIMSTKNAWYAVPLLHLFVPFFTVPGVVHCSQVPLLHLFMSVGTLIMAFGDKQNSTRGEWRMIIVYLNTKVYSVVKRAYGRSISMKTIWVCKY